MTTCRTSSSRSLSRDRKSHKSRFKSRMTRDRRSRSSSHRRSRSHSYHHLTEDLGHALKVVETLGRAKNQRAVSFLDITVMIQDLTLISDHSRRDRSRSRRHKSRISSFLRDHLGREDMSSIRHLLRKS